MKSKHRNSAAAANSASDAAGSRSATPSAAPAPPAPRLEFDYVQAKTLRENPHNWRRHPQSQLSALKTVLDDPSVGWAGALLYNKRTGRLVDGHGRLKVIDPDAFVPVLIGSWSDEAEKKILLTLDPLAALAQANAEQLTALLKDSDLAANPALGPIAENLLEQSAKALAQLTQSTDAGLRAVRAKKPLDPEAQADAILAADPNAAPDADAGTAPRATTADKFAIVIHCTDEAQQRDLLERFTAEKLECRALIA